MSSIDSKAFRNFTYGLFVITAKDGEKDNGCITNTAIQIADTPACISVSLNKNGLTHDMILKTGKFNLSFLTESAPMKVFQHFGFQSGRDINKFAECEVTMRTENGIIYVPKYTNTIVSGNVIQTIDRGSHTLFIASVDETIILNNEKSCSYSYYFEHIKPKPEQTEKHGWRCKICGYVHEDSELPADFVCPICKHGAEYFEKI